MEFQINDRNPKKYQNSREQIEFQSIGRPPEKQSSCELRKLWKNIRTPDYRQNSKEMIELQSHSSATKKQGWRHLWGLVGPDPSTFRAQQGSKYSRAPTIFGKNGPNCLKPIYWAPPHSKNMTPALVSTYKVNFNFSNPKKE